MAGEGSEKVMFRGVKSQIFVEEPYGPEAIFFYKIVFGATELCSLTKTINTSDKIKRSAKFESCELKFGPSSIIVSERNPDSSLVKKSSAGTRIRLEFEEIDSIIADAEELGAVCVRVEPCHTGLGEAEIKDPYGIIWIIRSTTNGRSPANMPPGVPAAHMEG